ncbi:MAG: flagellar hook capping FlgD N-terminal domain-containing protein [Lachnospiraceae bacterium]|nr:flagellar hook capping FlgD N-terminal domain-containing protein [Lachnospiraceae bacterium]
MDINTFGAYMATTSATASESSSTKANKSSLDTSDFLKLIAAQLRYQDMSNPMDNSEMMQQMTQMSSVTSMNDMSAKMNSIAEISTITYAASMIGKELTIATSQDRVTGVITTIKGTATGVGFYNGEPSVYVDGTAYSLSQIMSMGSTAKNTTPTSTSE